MNNTSNVSHSIYPDPLNPHVPTILIIDDQPNNLAVIGDYLTQCGFTILVSQTGVSGLRRAKDAKPDLILLDVLMPDMDGFETCQRLKSDNLTKEIPVLFMTALTGMEDKVKGFDVGGVDYITKPIQQEEVLARVRTHLQIRDQKKQLQQQAYELYVANERLEKEICIRRTAENELQRVNQELEKRIAERTAQLVTTNENLKNEIAERETAQKEADKVTDIFESFFTLLPDPACVASNDGLFKKVNPAWETVLGYTTGELLTKSFFDFIHPDDIESTRKVLRKQTAGDPAIKYNNRYRCKDGTYRWFEWNASPVKEMLLYAAARDITGRKIAEETIKKNAEQLQITNRELERANNQLKEIDEIKTEFVALASHELRTPLTSILGYAQTLLTSDFQLNDSIRVNILSTIATEAKRLARLIGNLLDISKIGAGNTALNDEVFDVLNLINNVVNTLNLPISFPVKIHSTLPKNCKAIGNSEQFGRAIRNILDNALRYVLDKGTITIEIVEIADFIRIGIIDTGPGIKPEEQSKIFDKFYRIRDEKYRSTGSGLGLSITAEIVKSQGGQIWVESQLGKGSTFYVTIPKEKKDA